MSDIVDRLRGGAPGCMTQGANEILRLRAENEKLRAALKPFADLQPEEIDCDENGEVIINLDDLRVARAAMGDEE